MAHRTIRKCNSPAWEAQRGWRSRPGRRSCLRRPAQQISYWTISRCCPCVRRASCPSARPSSARCRRFLTDRWQAPPPCSLFYRRSSDSSRPPTCCQTGYPVVVGRRWVGPSCPRPATETRRTSWRHQRNRKSRYPWWRPITSGNYVTDRRSFKK